MAVHHKKPTAVKTPQVTLEKLERDLTDEDWRVRHDAIRRHDLPLTAEQYERALTDEDEDVRMAAWLHQTKNAS